MNSSEHEVTVAITDPVLQHSYIPDGRGPQYDDDFCVAAGSAGMCGEPRGRHAR